MGKAAKDSKPSHNISNLVNVPKDEFQEVAEQQPDKNEAKPDRINKKIVNVNKNDAYQDFKNTVGLELNNTILKNTVS